MGVALTAALLAVLAAITALMAEHHANEAMMLQIQSSDQWNFYQAKSIKASLLTTKAELLKALGKKVEEKTAPNWTNTRRNRRISRRRRLKSSGSPKPICVTTRFSL